ncbi:MAG TPA: substrate-binding domain-containing protein [Micropepsaceae bacterium]|nr:substrate-binding domain-containing protein [Micropepsaceae bacterium]
MLPRLIGTFIVSAALIPAAVPASGAEIRMIASNAVKEPYLELIPQFEKATGHHVAVDWVGTDDAIRRIGGGEVADIVIAPSFAIDALIKQGHLAEGSRLDVAKSIIGVAIRPGAPKPDLSSGEGLKRSLLASKKIIISAGPSGKYLATLFQKMGIADQLKGRITQLASGESPGLALARGEGDIGFTQVSELLAIKGIEFLGPVPGDFQSVTIFSAGLGKGAPQPEAARALLKFVTAPQALPVLKKTGLEPG